MTDWIWPALFTSAITGIGVGIGFAFAMSKQISDLRSDIRDLGTRFTNWEERCDQKHANLDKTIERLEAK